MERPPAPAPATQPVLYCALLSSAPSMPNEKRKWKMENVALCAYLWLLFFGRPQSQIVNAGTGLDWTGDDCRLQVAASLLGPGWWLGDTRTGILFSKRVWGGGVRVGLGQPLFAFDGDSTK